MQHASRFAPAVAVGDWREDLLPASGEGVRPLLDLVEVERGFFLPLSEGEELPPEGFWWAIGTWKCRFNPAVRRIETRHPLIADAVKKSLGLA
jgi:hypothetical protein